MKKITLFGVTAAMLLSSATGAFAAVETFQPNAEGLFTVTADVAGVQKDAMYGVLAVAGDVLSETIDEEDITYIDQITATEAGKFSLANFGLKADAPNSTLYIGGAGLDGATEVAKLQVTVEVKGSTVSGQITSYDPKNVVSIQLVQSGEAKYTATIDALAEGSGQVAQNFSIAEVAAGTYDLVITKAGHIKYTVTGVVVADTDVAAPAITMLSGDVNADGAINASDVNVIYKDANFYKSTSEAADPVADLNGDGAVNASDVNQIYQEVHFYKGEADCTVPFVVAE